MKFWCDGFGPKNSRERYFVYEPYFMLSDEPGAGVREGGHEALRKTRGTYVFQG